MDRRRRVVAAGRAPGKNNVVGTLSVVKGEFPGYAVIGPEPAKLLYIKPHPER